MKKLLIALFILLGGSTDVFAASIEPNTINVDTLGEDSTLSAKILNELKIIRYHADKTDKLRENVIKKYKNEISSQHSNSENPSIVSAEFEVLSDIEEHTKGDNIKDGWNLYGWIAFILAFSSFVVSYITYRAQKNVEQQTKNASLKVQCELLDELYRHLYRNLVCTCAILYKFRGFNGPRNNKVYPSEANLRKLTTLPEDVIISIDIQGDDIYSQMHEIKKLLKNYNMEIDVASQHFCCKEIEDKYLSNDYDNLMFKPLFLITNVFKLWDKFHEFNSSIKLHKHDYAVYKFILEHFKKLELNKIEYNETYNFLKHTNNRLVKKNINQSVFDCLVFIKNNKENSIQRSLNEFCKSISTSKSYINPKDRKIKKIDFNNYLKSQGCDNVDKLLKDKLDEISPNNEKVNAILNSYYEFFKNDEWILDELIFYILQVDIALELPKIGMINYHSNN